MSVRQCLLALLACLSSTGCAQRLVGGVRFANAPIVWSVDDRRDVPEPPRELEFYQLHDYVYANVLFPLSHVLNVPVKRRAKNVNALGEVPDSTWFENRIGRRRLTPEDVYEGPDPRSRPLPPLTIESGKPGGAMPGFVVTDAKGDRYILKFDPKDKDDLETGSDVVVQRLLWAAGYHVPADEVFDLRLSQLRIAADATYKDEVGNKVPVTTEHVQRQMERVQRSRDGSYRAQVSKFLPGTPLGGHRHAGVRADDPNDVVAHEDRRDLRGAYVFFSWLAHTDYKQDNRIDMWVESPDGPGHHFVMHYLVDFGKALGVFARSHRDWDDTWAYNIDYQWITLSTLAVGLWKRPWEGHHGIDLQGVGRIDAAHYEPGAFRPRTPYLPFLEADRYDHAWATKILLRFERAHIEAAVKAARYRDPRAERYLVETLVARQRKAARHFLSKVNPIGDIRLSRTTQGYRLCAEELWHRYRLGRGGTSGHRAQVYDRRGRPLGGNVALQVRNGWVCLDGLVPARGRDAYTMVAFSSNRGAKALQPVWVHLARAIDTGEFTVIGIWRRSWKDEG